MQTADGRVDGSTEVERPGWTYLNFATPVVANTFTWLTALDKPTPALEREAGALGCLAELAGAIANGGAFRIGEQTVWLKEALAGPPAGREKSFPLRAIVVEAESLDYFSAPFDRTAKTTFLSRRAVIIETSSRCWDLVLVAASS